MSKKLCGTNYPLSICFVVVNEFCERFSYYGMKAVLTLYFLSYLKWDKDLSTAVYHAFSGLCYFTPILGAVIADSWLGKFKTIIYLSVVYVIGHVVKSVGAIPIVGNKDAHIALSMLGLILIAFGTGGIKPCVAAFGGDQFDEQHMKERQKFFSIFYMSVNAGSLLSTLITPVLKEGVGCFGEDCYALAFGVPAALMIVALAVFIAGSNLYKRNPPQGNILLQVCNYIGFALKNRWNSSKSDPKREHWLDWAEDKYSKRLIQEIKIVLRVLVLYIPLPMFWALFDQQGSRWTIQATRMNLAFGESFIIQPDQMQMLNALMILLLVPIFDLIVYPLIGLCRVNITPLRKMATGMIFAALAFRAATLVEVNVVKMVVEAAPAGECLLQVINLAEGNIKVIVPDSTLFPDTIPHLQDPPKYELLPLEASIRKLDLEVSVLGASTVCNLTFKEQKVYSLIVYKETTEIKCKLVEDHIYKNENGTPNVWFLNMRPEAVNVTVGKEKFFVPPEYSVSPNRSMKRGDYSAVGCSFQSKMCEELNLGLLDFGASYTFILIEESGKIVARKMEDVKANNVHIAWQIPQYALITTGEVIFSITGMEFSYSQAPTNMKSVLLAGCLFTVAFGNAIVLTVAEGAGLEQWKEFLLFAGLLLGVCIIFSIMAAFYTYANPEQLDKIYPEDSEKDEDDDHMKKKDTLMTETGKRTRQ
ncbi:solute carrier family 15 member 2-like [Nematolebias whitei]|uniref:solute carrier family 15 member 2-like n=1 Tax=Nematolebias whitei TaxID=451745 RepID=UPI00189B09C1|nr:solute carrier family 15 member 2-like [Nematolebias whitei]